MTNNQYAELVKLARQLATLDRTEGIAHSADAYAHALGKASGLGKLLLAHLEALKPERVRVLATDEKIMVTIGRDHVTKADTPALLTGSEVSEILDRLHIEHTYSYHDTWRLRKVSA